MDDSIEIIKYLVTCFAVLLGIEVLSAIFDIDLLVMAGICLIGGFLFFTIIQALE